MSADEFLELYHGTAVSRVGSIRTTGLFPRAEPRYPEYYSMLTAHWEIAFNWARLQPLGDRAVITYRVPRCEIDTYLHPSKSADLADYALKAPLPGSMITNVDTDIPEPRASSPASP